MSVEVQQEFSQVSDTNPATAGEGAPAAPAVETPPAAAPETPTGDAPDPAAAPAAPAFTPNFKFKVMEKEHEIPEFIRGVVKDADTEKQVRELFERSYGLDIVKERHKTTREELQTTRQELQGLQAELSDLRDHYQAGDLDAVFAKLSIPTEKILQYVWEKLNYNQLPPEQRQVWDERQAARREAIAMKREKSSYEEQVFTQAAQARAQEFQSCLARPDVAAIMKAFDERVGKPGDFVARVMAHGENTFYRSNGKIDLSPEQAINDVIRAYGLTAAPPQAAAPAPAAPAPQAAQTAKPKVIPNVSGSASSSPIPKVSSLEDLKRIAREKRAQN